MPKNLYNIQYTQRQEEVKKDPIPVDAQFVRTDYTGDKVFWLENGNAHWVTGPEALAALGGSFDDVKTIDYTIVKSYNERVEPVSMRNIGKFKTTVSADIPVETITLPAHEITEEIAPNAPQAEPEKGFTSIIIPAYLLNYPVFHMTGNCIGSIREHTDKEKTPYEIILILNGKPINSFSNMQETKADKVINNDENRGYSYAVNQGIRCAKGEYIAIVNNDVLVYDHWLEDLQEGLTMKDLVMATPMYGMPYARAVDAGQLRSKVDTVPFIDTFSDFTDFSCILTKKQLFSELGLFNEEFFMYGEDLDLLRRIKAAGKTYASTKKVNTTHIIQGTANYMPEIPDIMNESKAKLKEIWKI